MNDIDGYFLEETCSECREPNLHNKEAFEAGFEYAKERIFMEICLGPLNTLKDRIINLKVE